MKRKQIEELKAVSYSLETTLKTLVADIGQIPQTLIETLLQNNFKLAGPQVWVYKGACSDPDKTFRLEICQPVQEHITNLDEFTTTTLPEFPCVTHIHNGPWSNLASSYYDIFGKLQQHKIQPNGISREVYVHCDFENQENNVTEIQIGC